MLIESKEATALNEVQIIVQNVKTDKLYLQNVRDFILNIWLVQTKIKWSC
jgi:hypothetical protein